MRRSPALWLCAAALVACGKPTRERIERWRASEHGDAQLARVLADAQVEPDLRARAAAALVALGETDTVMRTLKGAAPVVHALVPLLAADARPAGPLQVPTSSQIAAKDALFVLRSLSPPADQAVIDEALADWLGGFYEGRSQLGTHHGEDILRAIGPRLAPRLLADVRAILAQTAPDATRYVLVKDELLRGLALSGPDGVGFLLNLAEKKEGAGSPDATLPLRAMQALAVTVPDVVPVLPRLVAIAADPRQPGANGNMAFDLIASAGKSHCLPPLAELARSKDAVRLWAAVQHGLDCAGADGIAPMAEALPRDRDYERGIIEKYFWAPAAALGSSALVPARALLRSPSWVARLTGVELLAKLGSASDGAVVRALGDDVAPLRGWRGARGKPATLGSEATAVADRLEKRAERQ